MRVSRPILIGVAAWLLVVVVGSTMVWAVISRAGEGVVSADPPTSSAQPTTEPTTDPSKHPTRRPTITDDPTSASPSATGSSAPPPTAEPVRRTWQGLGGTVVVSCTGAAVSLVGAQPDSGFSVEVHDRGPNRVEVQFEGRDDDSGGEGEDETRVRATCTGGVPAFEIDH
jgi:hypothetical protein